MAFRLLTRGGIYLLFIVGIAIKWVMTRMDKAKKQDFVNANNARSEEDSINPHEQHTNRDWRIRLAVIQKLRDKPDSESIPILIEHLSDEVYDVREATVSALVAHGEEAVISTIDVLLTGSLEAREMAVQVLAKSYTEMSIAALEQALLEDESAWVRIPAAEALGKIGDKSAVPTLVRALDDSHEDVYSAVVVALNQIGTLEAIQAIAEHPYQDDKKKRRSLPDDKRLKFSK